MNGPREFQNLYWAMDQSPQPNSNKDHFFDVITNSVGLVCALLAVRFHWWMDPVGAILVSDQNLQNLQV
jgi:hypothetical protein